MTETPKREYGLMIQSANRYGTEYVTVKVMVREQEKDHPCNPDSYGESSISYAPPHLFGLYLDGMGFDGHVMTGCGDPPRYIGYEVDYTGVYSIDSRKVEKMAKTFKRIRRQFDKDAPSEPGDIFMSLAAALKLTFAVWQRDEGPARSSYSDNRWRWATIPEGREQLRREIAAAVARADGRAAA